ncbi:MAG: DUF305 domain-containing protein [Anaerolineae bacterium]|nr:DUF305 domain-containing protein [Anaerolineae bacterium]
MKTDNSTTVDESTTLPFHPWFDPRILLAFATLILGAALGFWSGQQSMRPPAPDSAEVGFARDMASHHAQAVNRKFPACDNSLRVL